ncbi:hypothetical protein ACFL20_02960 [Spirochaetota bacterium]
MNFVKWIMPVLVIVLFWACNDTTSVDLSRFECSDNSTVGSSIILACGHTGWHQNDCSDSGCHSISGLSVGDHNGSETVPQCAACHGGNGACAPPPVTWHPKTSCSINCHGIGHDTYTVYSDCDKCHFASQGTIDCAMK